MTRSAARFLLGGTASTVLVLMAAGVLSAQDRASPTCWIRPDQADLEIRASPFDSTSIQLDGGEIKVCYSRPRMLGRPIVGRPSAGVAVEPGWYTLYVIPQESEWRIVVNATTERWGVPIDAAVRARDIGNGAVAVERTDSPVELLTMTLERISASEAALVAEWERTRVRIPIRGR